MSLALFSPYSTAHKKILILLYSAFFDDRAFCCLMVGSHPTYPATQLNPQLNPQLNTEQTTNQRLLVKLIILQEDKIILIVPIYSIHY